jgi:N6-adenosine-specific RNA methylase IME4
VFPSGAKGRDKRPGFDRLLKAVTRRKIHVVATWSVDRLGRSLQHLVSFLEELDAAGCDLYLHQQALDTTTPAVRAMFQMLGVFAEFERSIIRNRVKAGMTRALPPGNEERQADRPAAAAAGQGRADPRRAPEWNRHPQDSAVVRDGCLCGAADETGWRMDKGLSPKAHHYSVIYADPPWPFATYSAKGKGRSAEAHYNCMSLADIAAVPLREWAADDCVLLMWTTDPLLEKAFDIIHAWGFTYKTVGFYWVKLRKPALFYDDRSFCFGQGKWTRANPEPCLLATRGNPKRLSRGVRELIVAPRREHSRKPDEIYDRIERLVAGPYLELFARQRRPGWDFAFSNQIHSGPTPRRWKSNSYPGAEPGEADRQSRLPL